MTNIEFSLDGGLTWRVWCHCRADQAAATLARLQSLYADTKYLWREKEVVFQTGN
jgi:hypothetical protein